ncbi:hypothetical protein [Candidatus Albibeggiatoa sp. nov. NOAA]|uniref:hypothetical protein n=1 Tax=Candidatus Albibeggiatoa sp. nov. NOAA TaxID=3162724 RepID=UPI0032F77DD6|nr:hypothetical protein [Thiotrichaceae bacterium]
MMNNWYQLKTVTEKHWSNINLYKKGVYGFQIQQGTRWNKGLSIQEIADLEVLFNIALPLDCKRMLQVMNGFDQDHVDFCGGEDEKRYARSCYKYPDDWSTVQTFIAELYDNIKYIKIALEESGLAKQDIQGFIPLYGHRALVVFEDLRLSPVISAVGDDVIIYGNTLFEYWINEFRIRGFFMRRIKGRLL